MNSHQDDKKSASEQFENDARIWKAYLSSDSSNDISANRKDVMKRIFLTMSEGDVQFRNNESENFQSYSQVQAQQSGNGTPVTLAGLVSHGGRAVIEIPKTQPGEDPNAYINWVLGGNVEDKLKDKTIEKRKVSTHTTIDNGERIVEIKLKTNITDSPKMARDLYNNRNMGMDLGLGTPDKAAVESGSNGHEYMYYVPPSTNQRGVLMVGCEGSAPLKRNKEGVRHGLDGKPKETSATGGEKFEAMREQVPNAPRKIDGLRVQFSPGELNNLMQKSAKDFDLNTLSKPVGQTKAPQMQKAPANDNRSKDNRRSSRLINGLADGQRDLKNLVPAQTPTAVATERRDRASVQPRPESGPESRAVSRPAARPSSGSVKK